MLFRRRVLVSLFLSGVAFGRIIVLFSVVRSLLDVACLRIIIICKTIYTNKTNAKDKN